MTTARSAVGVGVLLSLVAQTALAGFAGTDVYLPMVGRRPGIYPSQWYTTVWVYNPNAVAADLTFAFLERDRANTSPLTYRETIPSGEVRKYDNAVLTLFGLEAWGAIRVKSTERVIVNERFYSITGSASAGSAAVHEDGASAELLSAAERGSVGQFFSGIPASFAIGLGERTDIVGVYQTEPSSSSDFRYNYGFVETTGAGVVARVTAFDESGVARGFRDHSILPFSQRQFAFKDSFPAVSTVNARLSVEVIAGAGRLVSYGTGIANGSQDPTTFEMAFSPAGGTITGVTAGEGLTGGGTAGVVTLDVGEGAGISVEADIVSIREEGVTTPLLADAAVTLAKLAAGPASTSLVSTLGTDGVSMFWLLPPEGGITAVETAPDSGLAGGAASGVANLSIAPGGVGNVRLAASAVTSDKIADGAVAAADVAFNYAGAASKGGPASDLACAGCVVPAEIGSTGAASGQVIKYNGSAVVWGADVAGTLTLPYSATTASGSSAFSVNNTGAGSGVEGFSTAAVTAGVWGSSSGGVGVRGTGLGSSSGVLGEASGSGNGVEGFTSGNAAVYGQNNGFSYGVYGITSGLAAAVMGDNRGTGIGVEGHIAGAGTGVWGESGGSGTGVVGFSVSNHGVHGMSTSGRGVYGQSAGSGGFGVYGYNSSSGPGVYGTSVSGWAGSFDGNVNVNGTLSKAAGGFRIDHPLDPSGKYLSHSFVESPDMMNVYNGNVTTDATGEAVVELPEWFEALNRDFRYQLTVMGGGDVWAQARVAREVDGNRFTIQTSVPRTKVSWQVTGIRHDAYAEAHRIPVEEEKPSGQQGFYLYPGLFGAPEETGIQWATSPELMRQMKAEREKLRRTDGAGAVRHGR